MVYSSQDGDFFENGISCLVGEIKLVYYAGAVLVGVGVAVALIKVTRIGKKIKRLDFCENLILLLKFRQQAKSLYIIIPLVEIFLVFSKHLTLVLTFL